jgi:hypothetical protein
VNLFKRRHDYPTDLDEIKARNGLYPRGDILAVPTGSSTGLSGAQQAWLDDKATDQGCLEIGPCRFLGETLVVHVQTLFDRETFVIDREGNEI